MVSFELYEKPAEEPGKVQLISVISDTGIGMTEEFMKEMYSGILQSSRYQSE